MTLIDELQDRLIEKSVSMSAERFALHGLWEMDLAFRPNVHERTFQYHVKIAQTVRQGACYCFNSERTLDADLIGTDARYIQTEDIGFRTAILDAAYSALHEDSIKDFHLEGTAEGKASRRADIVVAEVLEQIEAQATGERSIVVNVGVIGTIVEKLKQHGIVVHATDLDPSLVGQRLNGVLVRDGERHTLELVAQSDVALVTGMTLANDSLADILRVAEESETRLVIFAETGAWFAQELCDGFGVDAVIAEPFPFYIFAGKSLLRLHRPNRGHG